MKMTGHLLQRLWEPTWSSTIANFFSWNETDVDDDRCFNLSVTTNMRSKALTRLPVQQPRGLIGPGNSTVPRWKTKTKTNYVQDHARSEIYAVQNSRQHTPYPKHEGYNAPAPERCCDCRVKVSQWIIKPRVLQCNLPSQKAPGLSFTLQSGHPNTCIFPQALVPEIFSTYRRNQLPTKTHTALKHI